LLEQKFAYFSRLKATIEARLRPTFPKISS
jgi:hypothetical protein